MPTTNTRPNSNVRAAQKAEKNAVRAAGNLLEAFIEYGKDQGVELIRREVIATADKRVSK